MSFQFIVIILVALSFDKVLTDWAGYLNEVSTEFNKTAVCTNFNLAKPKF